MRKKGVYHQLLSEYIILIENNFVRASRLTEKLKEATTQ